MANTKHTPPAAPRPNPLPPPQPEPDVDEAGDESFPASDPPSWNSSEAVPHPQSKKKDPPDGKQGR